jgi:hypothetical protein
VAEVVGPAWPEALTEAVGTRGFRNELRDLLMRAVEHGHHPEASTSSGASKTALEAVSAGYVLRHCGCDGQRVVYMATPGQRGRARPSAPTTSAQAGTA